MSLVLPVPSTRTGPTYASDINAALTLLDSHSHSSGQGVKVTPAGLQISSDLDIGSNNLTAVRSLRLNNQTSALVGASEVCSLSFVNGNLTANNNSGTAIQITSGSGLNTAGLVVNAFSRTTTTTSLVIAPSDSFVAIDATLSSAITITLPAANGVSAGRYYLIHDVSGNSLASYNITLHPAGSDKINGANSNQTLASDFGSWLVYSDGTSNWVMTDISLNNQVTYNGSRLVSASSASSILVAGVDTTQHTTTYGDFLDTVAEVSTTDATVTSLYTWTIQDNAHTMVHVSVVADKSDSSSGDAWTGYVLFKRDGGTVTAGIPVITHVGATAWDVTIDNSTSTGRVRITGAAATTIRWSLRFTRHVTRES